MDWEYGKVKVELQQLLVARGFSQTNFAQRANMQQTQLKKYLLNDISLIDKDVLGRMCTVLNCQPGDILKFIPPNSETNNKE